MAGELLIREVDYAGTVVTCTREYWAEKVEADHPELRGRHEDVAEVIRDPHFVFQDRDYGDRRQHYRRQDDGLFLKVVVRYRYDETTFDSEGVLVTAFLQNTLRGGDRPLFANVRR